jgi:hypothetical protein
MNCFAAGLDHDAGNFQWRDAVWEVNDPELIPTIRTPAESAPESLAGAADETNPCTDQGNCKRRYVVYPGAARFPLLGYDKWGCQVEQNAAVIYEGMAICIKDNGDFTVRFVMEAPATAMTVRLQFVVWNANCEKVGTVTLPPLHFNPDQDARKAGENQLWKVQQTGYSPLLRCDYLTSNCALRVERTGSARIGSAPERQNLF